MRSWKVLYITKYKWARGTNLGSGTPQEAAEWLEYLTAAQPTTLAKERAANGHAAPYKIPFLGIGNESWDCGGNMAPEAYLTQLKIYG